MPILVLNFDGTMTTYASGWQGIDCCPDPPVAGLEAFLTEAARSFEVHVFSSRSHDDKGILAMRMWCYAWLPKKLADCLSFPKDKPPAMVTLDDRAITFTGQWPAVQTLLDFQPWTRNTPPPNERALGQVAYAAYAVLPGARRGEPWTALPSWEQQRWEAAAQAVLGLEKEERHEQVP